MDDLQTTLQSLLDDPEELQRLAQTASTILGGEDQHEEKVQTPDLRQIMQMLGRGSGGSSKKLVAALSPYLSSQRRARLERAARIASLSSIAELALGSDNEDG